MHDLTNGMEYKFRLASQAHPTRSFFSFFSGSARRDWKSIRSSAFDVVFGLEMGFKPRPTALASFANS
jgi:hypothetical protein